MYAMGQWLGGAYYEGLRERGIKNQVGPESSHILWTRPYTTGGIMGGPNEDVATIRVWHTKVLAVQC